jgi:paraquat-inducible protein B
LAPSRRNFCDDLHADAASDAAAFDRNDEAIRRALDAQERRGNLIAFAKTIPEGNKKNATKLIAAQIAAAAAVKKTGRRAAVAFADE